MSLTIHPDASKRSSTIMNMRRRMLIRLALDQATINMKTSMEDSIKIKIDIPFPG
jgi:hypothetical protein